MRRLNCKVTVLGALLCAFSAIAAAAPIDTAVSTPTYPADRALVNTQPNFNWVAPSTATIALLSANAYYDLQVSNNDPDFNSSVIRIATPAVVVGISTSEVNGYGQYFSTFTLAGGTTYYWRVRTGDAGSFSSWSSTFSFYTDFSAPVPSAFKPWNAAGPLTGESDISPLALGATVQISVQDPQSGIAVSTIVQQAGDGTGWQNEAEPFGVMYSTTAGATWYDGAWSVTNGGEGLHGTVYDYITAMASHAGKLFAGSFNVYKIAAFDGSNWTQSADIQSAGVNSAAYSFGAYKGELYAGLAGGRLIKYNEGAGAWEQAFGTTVVVPGTVVALAEYNGRFFAAGSGGDISVYDGVRWTRNATGLVGTVNALFAFNGKLFLAPNGSANIYEYDGRAWRYATAAGITEALAFAEHNGRLYAAGGTSNSPKVYFYDFNTGLWTSDNGGVRIGDRGHSVNSLLSFNGKLYASVTASTYVYVSDGLTWRRANNGLPVLPAPCTGTKGLASYKGKLYVGGNGGANTNKVAELSPTGDEMQGAHGSTAGEIFKAFLDLRSSTNTLTCGGNLNCGAINQVIFNFTDRAGNASRYGPYAVMVDTLSVSAVITPDYPSGFVTAGRPNFSWGGPSTTTIAQVMQATYYLLVDDSEDFGSPVVSVSTPVVVNPAMPTADGSYLAPSLLTEGVTYYWKVRLRTSYGMDWPWSSTRTFVVDRTAPAASGFQIKSSTGGWLSNTQQADLLAGVTVQVSVQDALSGLLVSTFGGADGFGVSYSTDAGRTWLRESLSNSFNGATYGVYSLAVHGGKLYAGQGAGPGTGLGDIMVFDGTSWNSVYNGSYDDASAMISYNGKLYAGFGSDWGDGDILSYDGDTWTLSYDGGEQYVTSMAVYNGKLYAGLYGNSSGVGDIIVFDGTKWSRSYDTPWYLGTHALAVYNGKLYAGVGTNAGWGDVLVFDGASWSVAHDGWTQQVLSLHVHNGKLYAGTGYGSATGEVLVYDGSSWSVSYDSPYQQTRSIGSYGGALYAGEGYSTGLGDIIINDGPGWRLHINDEYDTVNAFAVYKGRFYAGRGNSGGQGDVSVYAPLAVSTVTGSNGNISPQTLSAVLPYLAVSTNTQNCSNAASCGATNQVRFQLTDLAGNTYASGIYSLLADGITSAHVSTPSYPSNGAVINYARPSFAWIGLSTTAAAMLGGSAQYLLEADNDPDFSSVEVSLSTPIVLSSTMNFTCDGLVTAGSDLANNTTYYWRVRVLSAAGNYGAVLTTYSFVTDFTMPAAASFRALSSTGGWLSEGQLFDVTEGLSARAEVQDAGSGLAVSSGVLKSQLNVSTGAVAFGVIYSTSGGSSWIDGAWSDVDLSVLMGSALIDAQYTAEYGGKLYVSFAGSSDLAVFDGTGWNKDSGLTSLGVSGVYALAAHGGKLYAGGGSCRVAVYDGASWSLTDHHLLPVCAPGAYAAAALASHNGRLYAGLAHSGAANSTYINVYDGGRWTTMNNGRPLWGQTSTLVNVQALGSYRGRLYAGLSRSGVGNVLMAFDGVSWSTAVAGTGDFHPGVEYNGKFYIPSFGAQVNIFNGTAWTTKNPGYGNYGSRIAVHGGRLYMVSHFQGGGGSRINMLNPATDSFVPVSQIYPHTYWGGANEYIGEPISYKGRLYVAMPNARLLAMEPPPVSLSVGADGATGQAFLQASGLSLAQSQNLVACNGLPGCTATNQVIFTVSDRSGLVRNFGPYSVLAESLRGSQLLVSTPAHPAAGSFAAAAKPGFSWVGVSTSAAALLGPAAAYVLDVDNNADFSSPAVLLSTPVVVHSTVTPTADSAIQLSTHTLADNTTYYWRVRVRTALGGYGLHLATASFLTDQTRPSGSSFAVLDAAGLPVSEGSFITLTAGVTAQVFVQDAGSGLALSTASLDSGGGVSVFYSTNSGNTWVTGSWAYLNGGAAIPEFGGRSPQSSVVYGERLYVGMNDGTVFSFNGSAWLGENGQAAPLVDASALTGMYVWRGRLYVINSSGYIGYFDGSSWTSQGRAAPHASRLGPEYNGRLAAHSPGLYLGGADGSWAEVSAGVFPVSDGPYYAAQYSGRLYLGMDSGSAGNDAYVLAGSSLAAWRTPWSNGNYFRGVAAYDGKLAMGNQGGLYYYNPADNSSQFVTGTNSGAGFMLPYRSSLLYNHNSSGPVFRFADLKSVSLQGGAGDSRETQFQGKIYNVRGDGKVYVYTPAAAASWTGADGIKGSTLTVTGLNLVQSTAAAQCGGSWSCGATNQVVFVLSDLAGNAQRAGPYAVNVDVVTGNTPAPVPGEPPAGSYVAFRRPVLAWGGPSSSTVNTMGASASYNLQVSNNDPSFSSKLVDTNVAVAFSTGNPTFDGSYAFASDLPENTTIYWRVQLKNDLNGGVTPWSAASSFVTDFTPPALTSYGVLSSTGGPLGEAQWLALAGGATVQFAARDEISGLAVSSTALPQVSDGEGRWLGTSGYGVIYSTKSSYSWADGQWSMTNGGSPVYAVGYGVMAAYKGYLYNSQGNRMFRFRDGTWSSAMVGPNASVDFCPGAFHGYSLAVYKDKLYAGFNCGRVAVYDNATWQYTSGGSDIWPGVTGVYNMTVYNNKLYAGTNAGLLVYDGQDWKMASTAYSGPMAVYNGRLFVGYGRKVAYYNGSTWTPTNGGNDIFSSGSNYQVRLIVYAGKLYSFYTNNGQIAYYTDSGGWTVTGNAPIEGANSYNTTAAVFRGRLYVGHENVSYTDGKYWRRSMGSIPVIGGGATPTGTRISGMAEYNGRLYASDWTGKVAEFTPEPAALTGADGATDIQVAVSSAVPFAQSINATQCAGSACTAVNQVLFNVSDRAGNTAVYGPYAVLADRYTSSQLPVPGEPAAGSYVNMRRPTLAWVGPSSDTVSAMGGNASFNIQLSDNDPAFSAPLADANVAVTFSTNNPTFDGTYAPGADLPENTTVYWRVQLRNNINGFASQWATSTFVTDYTPPVPSSFRISGPGGSLLDETQWVSLSGAPTVQVSVSDLGSGLAVSTSSMRHGTAGHDWGDLTSGFSVKYTTSAGANWMDNLGWTLTNGGSPVGAGYEGVLSMAVYRGRLYAGMLSNTYGVAKVAYYDRDSDGWTFANGNTAVGSGNSVNSMAVFNDKLYAGTAGGVIGVYNGNNWTTTTIPGANQVLALEAYNGRLYAGTNLGAHVLYGDNWVRLNGGQPIAPGATAVRALKVYDGKLYASFLGSGSVYFYNGTSWTNAGIPVGGTSNVYALAVYGGKLYASSNGYAVGRYDGGTSWTSSGNLGGSNLLYTMAVHDGKLYVSGRGDIHAFDGARWSKSNSGAKVVPGVDEAYAMAIHDGRLFVGGIMPSGGAPVARSLPLRPSLTGSDGSVSAELLVSSAVPFVQSTNGLYCSGVAPCSARNQVIFNVSDRAGNVSVYGPYAVLLDRFAGSLAPPVPGEPSAGAYVNIRRPTLAWGGPSTTTVADMGGNVSFNIQLSDNDPAFSATLADANVAVTFSTNNPTFDGTYAPGADLPENTTVYWRVQIRNNLTGFTTQWATSTFVTDFTPPSGLSFSASNSTGGYVTENTWISLAAGATVQASVRDQQSGLAVSTAALPAVSDGHDLGDRGSGYGVRYSTNGGANWVEGSAWTAMNGGAAVSALATELNALAVYRGKLYAATNDGAKVAVYDGANWGAANSGNAVVSGHSTLTSMAVYNDKLYIGGATGKIAVYDGIIWSVSNGGNAVSPSGWHYGLAVYNNKLYAAGAGARVYVFDGSAWLPSNGGQAVAGATTIQSLAVYDGKLYAGLSGGKVAVFNGSAWSLTNGGGQILGASAILSMAVYNGRLYAGTEPWGRVAVFDRDTQAWSDTNGGQSVGGYVRSLAVFNGKLYAGTGSGVGKVSVYDGNRWNAAAGQVINGQNDVRSLAAYNGRLYAGVGAGLAAELSPLGSGLTGPDGGTGSELLVSSALPFAQSAVNTVCLGFSPCGATNQVVFNVSDMAGNVTAFGPYAVLLDRYSEFMSRPAPGEPAAGAYVNVRRPRLAWTGPSTTTVAAMGSNVRFSLQVSDNDASFSSPLYDAAVTVTLSTVNLSLDGSYVPAADLPENTTIYWRVRAQNTVSGFATQWATSTFVTDFTAPAADAFRVRSSTGGLLSEAQWVSLPAGVTAQVLLRDLQSGLSSSSGGGASGFGLAYSGNSGGTWSEPGAWSVTNGGAPVVAGNPQVTALEEYNGSLYAATGDSTGQVARFDGANWVYPQLTRAGGTTVAALKTYNGKLYASAAGRVDVFDGVAWLPANGGALLIPGAFGSGGMAVYNGRLYVAVLKKVAVFDGSAWSSSSGQADVLPYNLSRLHVHNGRLYAYSTASGGQVAVFNGQTWSITNGGATVGGATRIYELETYNGRLYAAVYSRKVFVYDEAADSWGLALDDGSLDWSVSALKAFNGKLYLAGGSTGKLWVYNGLNWAVQNGGSVAVDGEGLASLRDFGGRLFAGTNTSGKVAVFDPARTSLTGQPGSRAWEALVSSAVPFAQSLTGTICASVSPCASANQAVFTASDRAGNVLTYGPYAVLVDTTPPAASVSAFSAAGAALTLQAAASDPLSGVRDYSLWVSPDETFASQVSSTAYSASASAVFSGLEEATLYYGRVYARDNAFNEGYSVSAATTTGGVVHVSSHSVSPAEAMQGTDAAMLAVSLRTNPGRTASLASLTVTKGTSTASSSDISAVKVYRDNNGDLALDAGDTLLGTAGFAGINALVTLTPPLAVPDTGASVLVAYSFASGATVDRTAKAEVTAASGLSFAAPFAAAGDFPLRSGFTRVTDGPNTLNITASNIAPTAVAPGTGNLGLVKLAMQTNVGTSILSSVTVRLGGTLPGTSISGLKLYRDANANAQFDVASDLLVTSGADIFIAGGSTMTLTASAANRTIGATPVYFFLAADVAADAAEGANFSLLLDTGAYFSLANPVDAPVLSPAPYAGNTVTVQTNNTANINIYSLAPAEAWQGGKYAMALASCSVSVGVAELNRVKVNRTGSAGDSDLKAAWLYRDDGNGSYNPNFDAAIGSAAFSGGVATVDIATVTLTGGATTMLFVVYEISPSAGGGLTVGAGFTNNTYFRMASANTAVSGNFPVSTASSLIRVTVNPLLVQAVSDMTTGELFQGTTNNALLRLQLRSELNPVTWTALRLKKTGTLADEYVDAVKVFRDSDGDGSLDASDELVSAGSDLFSGGEAAVSFALPQAVDYSGGYYFVAVDLDPEAPNAYTLGVEVTTTSWLSLNSPNYVSTGSVAAPYTGGPALVKQYPNVVSLSTASILPASGLFPGTADIPVLKLNFRTDISKADLLSVKFSRLGTLSDAEVKRVKLYCDTNNLGVFNNQNLAAYALVTASTVTYGSTGEAGVVSLNLDSNRQVTRDGRNYFLAVDLATSAAVGRTLVMRLQDNSYVTVSAPNTVAPLAVASQQLTVQPSPQVLSASFQNKLSTWVVQGDLSVLVASFTVSASSHTIDLTRVQAARTGSGFDSDLSALKLYRDDGNGYWNGISSETLLGTSLFSAGLATFSPAGQTVSTSPVTYYFVADVSETASSGRTFGITLPAAGYLGVNEPHSVAAFSFSGQTAEIQPTVDTLRAEYVSAAPALRQADQDKVLGRMRLYTQTRSASFVTLRIDKAGSLPDADLSKIRLYKDDGDLSLDSGDELVGTLSSLASGSGVMVLSPAQAVNSLGSIDYLLTVDIATYAAIGSTFTLTVAPAVLSPDVVAAGNSSYTFTTAGSVQDNPDTVFLSFSALGTQSLYLGTQDNALAKLGFWTASDEARLSGVRLSFTGTAGPSDLAAVKLYRDTDGNGHFSAAYDVLAATAALAAGEAWLTLPGAGDAVTASTRTYFAAVDVGPAATIGNTATLGLPSAANITLSGIDVMDDFAPKAGNTAAIRDPRIPTPPALNFFKADGRLYGDIDESFNAYRTLLKFRWSASAHQGSIEQVYYYIGSTPATDAGPWTAAGTGADVTVRGLNLLNNGSYYISVRVKNALGAFYSDIVSKRLVVDTVPPSLPAAALYTTEEGGSKLLNWPTASVGVSGVEYYVVEERRGNSPLWVAVSTTSDRYLPVELAGSRASDLARPAGAYYYRVYAVNNAGVAGTPSDPLAFNLGLEALGLISEASFYPNPVDTRRQTGTIAFTLSRAGQVTINIYDAFGRKVKGLSLAGSVGANSASWSGDGAGGKVSTGMYLCVIKMDGETKVLKIGVKH